MNRFRQWLSQHQGLWEVSIDLLAAWAFTAGAMAAVCCGFEGLGFGLSAWRAAGLALAGVLLVFLVSRKWWILPGAAALGGLALWRASYTEYWEEILEGFQDYAYWWVSGFPQGKDVPYHIQWVQLLAAVLVGAVLLFVMRRLFSFIFLLFGSIGAAVVTAFFSAGGITALYPCLAFFMIGLIIVLPRVYARYLETHNILGNSPDTQKAVPVSRASLQLLAVPAALVCVGMAFWMVPEDTSEWKSESLVHFLWDMGDLFRFSIGRSEGYWEFQLSSAGYETSLDRLGGPVELSDDTFFEIKTEFPVLLRGSVQDTYTGTGWFDSYSNGRFRLDSPIWNGKQKDIFGVGLPKEKKAKELYQRLTREFSFQIYPRKYQYCTIFNAGRTEGAGYLTSGEEIYFNTQGEMFTKNYISSPYSVTGREFLPRRAGMDQEMLLLERLAEGGTSKEMKEVCKQYLQLPESLPQTVRDMAESITRNSVTPYQKAAALCDWLAQNCTYTLCPEPLPDGRDFVDYFLETREGYCVYYASAMTVMARCAGLPARFVSGFGMRESDRENWYYTSEETAHAWSEIYLDHIGWVPFDPLGWDSSPVVVPDEPEESSPVPDDPFEDEELEEEDFSPVPVSDVPEKNTFIFWPFVLVLLLGAMAAGVWAVGRMPVWVWKRDTLEKAFPQPEQRADWLYRDVLWLLSFLGYVPETGETAFEFAQRVDGRLQIDGFASPMRDAAGILVKMQFGGIAPTDLQINQILLYHQKLEYFVKIKLGKTAYWWRRCVPCIWKTLGHKLHPAKKDKSGS